MKIGIVTPLDPRTGISSYSQILAGELANLGEDVSLISPEISKQFFTDEDVKFVSHRRL